MVVFLLNMGIMMGLYVNTVGGYVILNYYFLLFENIINFIKRSFNKIIKFRVSHKIDASFGIALEIVKDL